MTFCENLPLTHPPLFGLVFVTFQCVTPCLQLTKFAIPVDDCANYNNNNYYALSTQLAINTELYGREERSVRSSESGSHVSQSTVRIMHDATALNRAAANNSSVCHQSCTIDRATVTKEPSSRVDDHRTPTIEAADRQLARRRVYHACTFETC